MFLVCCRQLKSPSRQVSKPADMNSGAILPFLHRGWSVRLQTSRTGCKSVIELTPFGTVPDVTNSLDDLSNCLPSGIREIARAWMCKWTNGKPWRLDRTVGHLPGRDGKEPHLRLHVTCKDVQLGATFGETSCQFSSMLWFLATPCTSTA